MAVHFHEGMRQTKEMLSIESIYIRNSWREKEASIRTWRKCRAHSGPVSSTYERGGRLPVIGTEIHNNAIRGQLEVN